MSKLKHFTPEEARRIGDSLKVDWEQVDLEEFCAGLHVELEHGVHDPQTNVTNDDLVTTGKIALAHLKEFADYYTRLEKMEEEATPCPPPGWTWSPWWNQIHQ
ncbi:MAG: DUF5661 family protein [Endomicrobiales bacterium]